MSKRGDVESLNDIREAIARIKQYLSGLSYEVFLKDEKTQDAVIRNLEIIGEAAKNLSGDIKKRYPFLPWKKLAGIRDRLIHQYFGVNFDIVWNVARNELLRLQTEIKKIIKDHE